MSYNALTGSKSSTTGEETLSKKLEMILLRLKVKAITQLLCTYLS